MSERSWVVAALVAAATLAGCTGTAPAAPPTWETAPSAPGTLASTPASPAPSPGVAAWQADLDALLPALQTVRTVLVHMAPPPALAAAVAALRAHASGLNDDQLMVGVMRIMT